MPRAWGQGLAALVALAILVAVASRLDLGRVAQALAETRWNFVVAAAALNLVNTALEAERWRTLIRPLKREARTRHALAALFAGVAGNAMLPLRLGEGLRAFVLARREQIDLAAAMSTVLVDRVIDVAVFLVLVTVAASGMTLPPGTARTVRVGSGVVAGTLALAWLVSRWVRRRDARASAGAEVVAGRWHQLVRGFAGLRDVRVLATASVFAVASWVARAGIVWVMFRACGLALPPSAAVTVLVVINLANATVNAPANLGALELGAVAGLAIFGVEAERALGYAVALHAAELGPPLLAGLAVLSHEGLSLAAARAAARTAPRPWPATTRSNSASGTTTTVPRMR
jgi:uncharacterized protein (TIRG00374 family)